MQRRTLLKTSLGATLATILGTQAGAQDMDETTQASFDTVMAFMGAMGSGDMEQMSALMADDMVWHNEGDATLPWIGEMIQSSRCRLQLDNKLVLIKECLS